MPSMTITKINADGTDGDSVTVKVSRLTPTRKWKSSKMPVYKSKYYTFTFGLHDYQIVFSLITSEQTVVDFFNSFEEYNLVKVSSDYKAFNTGGESWYFRINNVTIEGLPGTGAVRINVTMSRDYNSTVP